MPVNEADRVHRQAVGDRFPLRRLQRLHGVGQRVHPRRGGEQRRELRRHDRIQDGDPRRIEVFDAEDLLPLPLVEDDGHAGDLAPRPRRRGDDDVRRLRPGEELYPLEVLDAAPFRQEDADHLSRVDDAPSPHADDAIGPLLPGEGRGPVDNAHAGVLGNVAEQADALVSERFEDPLDQPRLHHSRIGQDERPAAAESAHLHLAIARRPGAEDHLRRTEIDERQIPIVCHGSLLCGKIAAVLPCPPLPLNARGCTRWPFP